MPAAPVVETLQRVMGIDRGIDGGVAGALLTHIVVNRKYDQHGITDEA